MTHGQLFAKRNLSPQDRHAFEQWLKGCAAIGAVLSLGLMAMALAGSRTAETEIISRQPHVLSFQEHHSPVYRPASTVHSVDAPVRRHLLTVDFADI